MALIEILMPQMGESVIEATIISWLKKEGEKIEAEEPLLEVATDKVDTEVPSVHEGIIKEFLAKEGEIVQIGAPIALLSTDAAEIDIAAKSTGNGDIMEKEKRPEVPNPSLEAKTAIVPDIKQKPEMKEAVIAASIKDRFYSPLVKNIAKEEHISSEELEAIEGTGKDGSNIEPNVVI